MAQRITLQQGLAAVRTGDRYGKVMGHGKMHAGIYAPLEGEDTYVSEQDVVYMVASGAGIVRCEDDKWSFTRGDVLLVPAGEKHRFENITPDLAVWAVNWGPEDES